MNFVSCPMPASKSPTRSAAASSDRRKDTFEIGRRETNDLRLAGSEVSRDHAEIVAQDNGRFVIRDQQLALRHVRQRRAGHRAAARARRPHPARPQRRRRDGVPARRQPRPPIDKATTTAIGDLRQIAALLEGLRALGSGRVLDDVLALVLDSAIEVSGAERGFIMLAGADRRARVQDGARRAAAVRCRAAASRPAARSPRKCSAPASRASSPTCSTASSPTCTWARSRSASATSSACRCKLVRYVDRAEAAGEERRIGVLYLDSREKGIAPVRLDARRARDARDRSGGRDRERPALSRDDGEGADGAGDADRGRDPAGAAAEDRPRRRLLPRGRGVAAVPIDRRRLLRLRRPAGRRVRLRARRRRRARARPRRS